jgi:hypothetical protein
MHTVASMIERFHAVSRKPDVVTEHIPHPPVTPEEIRLPEPEIEVKSRVKRKKIQEAAEAAAPIPEDEQSKEEE